MVLLKIVAESHNTLESCESVRGVTYTKATKMSMYVNLAKSRD